MRNKYSISGFPRKASPIGLPKATPLTPKSARNSSRTGNKRRQANFTLGAIHSPVAWLKSLFSTNSRVICIAAARSLLRKTAWHYYWRKKPCDKKTLPKCR